MLHESQASQGRMPTFVVGCTDSWTSPGNFSKDNERVGREASELRLKERRKSKPGYFTVSHESQKLPARRWLYILKISWVIFIHSIQPNRLRPILGLLYKRLRVLLITNAACCALGISARTRITFLMFYMILKSYNPNLSTSSQYLVVRIPPSFYNCEPFPGSSMIL
jgi:hypothetical protein